MNRIKMQRVENPNPSTMAIIECRVTPAIRGEGDTDYLCAGCGKTMLRKVSYKQVQKLVFKCPHCSTHSQIPTTHHSH